MTHGAADERSVGLPSALGALHDAGQAGWRNALTTRAGIAPDVRSGSPGSREACAARHWRDRLRGLLGVAWWALLPRMQLIDFSLLLAPSSTSGNPGAAGLGREDHRGGRADLPTAEQVASPRLAATCLSRQIGHHQPS